MLNGLWLGFFLVAAVSALAQWLVGGNAGIFDAWPAQLPDGVELFAVQAPGRASRFAEAPIGLLADKVAALQTAIAPYLDLPHVLLGHSNGALTAFELARRLESSGDRNLRHVILSGKRAPHLPRTLPVLHTLPDAELVEQLRALDATPAEILDYPEALELFLPMLRADFALSEVGAIARTPLLRADCTLFFGREDDMEREEVAAWNEYLHGTATLRAFDGGHFFINEHRDTYLKALGELLLTEIARLDPPAAGGIIPRKSA